ncbi:M4 family metallopeptidase [Hymenobacter jejuensis]|uniref:T9SS type A sorting domain-containing protein n=1 Tax=Hymenobacter jejuensis TaxID=2502781 RepID=A0A5B7ZZA1_9BACT|nr:M4 family metallopeptidase [Hymenobacter jejuensis]QDA60368.1 T9SS type A sorting domain-containing protein [Hymenobacter jejuensis]
MTKKYSAVALLMLGGLAQFGAQAQNAKHAAQRELAEDGSLVLVQYRGDTNPYKQSEGKKALTDELELSADDQMLQAKTETDDLGFVHEKYNQYYRGIKVEHAAYSVHARKGTVEGLSGKYERIKKLDTTPSLDQAAALQRALSFVGAKKYMWQDAAEEAGLKEQENNPSATYKPQGELVIVRSQAAKNGKDKGEAVLAWKFNIYAQQPVSRAYIYVDAHTGEVVMQDDIIKHTAATATFATAYSGTRSLANETTTGGYRLREYTRGLGVETYNCKKGSSYTSATDFIDADNSWTEYNNANYDNVAGDAHFGAQATYDYWKDVFARNSYDNAGAKIKSYVHFDDTPGDGKGYENAYWNGSVMTYGDGAATFKPLTALDVCGHEIGHAVCEKTANLTYANESGALNEGFSDIWGACVEQYNAARYGLTKSTWLIGEDIMKAGGALRSMSDPKSEGQPAYYKGQYWAPLATTPSNANDQGGVHTNSGVLNHWFYILAVGKSGTNEGGGTYSVTGQGITDAAKIAFRAESVYLTASSNYASARTYTIQAATDLFGAGSAQVIATTNAWYAVGVGAAYSSGGTTPPPTVTYCTSKGNSTAYEWIDYVKLGTIARTSGADAGYYNGTATSTSVAAGSSQTINFSAGFASTAYTEYWKVYIDYNQNGLFTDSGELVVSGSSSSSGTLSATFTVPTTAKTGNTRMRIIMSDASATASCNAYSYGETEDYTLAITGGAALAGNVAAVRVTSDAQLSNEIAKSLEVYPNPATDQLYLTLPNNGAAVSVQVTDVRGAKAAGFSYDGKGSLNISGLAKGLYTLTVSDGQKVFHQRFVKQ